MLTIKHYVRPQSLKEAYELLMQRRSNVILGGMLWLKMQNKQVHTAIDLQDLDLNRITEGNSYLKIGAMVPLRDLELHEGLNAMTQGAVAESLRHIVGVQFRNTATVGGTVYGRFGFSDVLTLLLALDTKVDLYRRGVITLEEFLHLPRSERDLLIRILIPKAPRKTVYLSQRNSATDFPVLTCAVSQSESGTVCAVGARPGKALCLRDLPQDPDRAAQEAAARLDFGSNVRAGADYRRAICKVLVRRALTQLQQKED